MRTEYDFSDAVRGVTARRYARGRNTVSVTGRVRSPRGNRADDHRWDQDVRARVAKLLPACHIATTRMRRITSRSHVLQLWSVRLASGTAATRPTSDT